MLCLAALLKSQVKRDKTSDLLLGSPFGIKNISDNPNLSESFISGDKGCTMSGLRKLWDERLKNL